MEHAARLTSVEVALVGSSRSAAPAQVEKQERFLEGSLSSSAQYNSSWMARRTYADNIVLIISLLLFIASLAMPALEFRQQPPVLGVTTLLWGWWGVLTGDFPWFANGAYFVSALFAGLKQRVVAIVCSAIALGLGSLSHWVGKWYFNEAEGTPVERLGAAYYFWMASFAVLLVGMARVRIARRGETGGRS